MKSDFAEAYYGRGNVYGELKQYQQAINDLDEAIRLKPDLFGGLLWTGGNVYYGLKQYQQAINRLRRNHQIEA